MTILKVYIPVIHEPICIIIDRSAETIPISLKAVIITVINTLLVGQFRFSTECLADLNINIILIYYINCY